MDDIPWNGGMPCQQSNGQAEMYQALWKASWPYMDLALLEMTPRD